MPETIKSILAQYCDMQEEVKDLRHRIDKLYTEMGKMEEQGYVVSDCVKGTRSDGTYGPITITGFPYPEYTKKRERLRHRQNTLQQLEDELQEMLMTVDEYINDMPDSRMRRIFRYRYLDELSWVQVAHQMGGKNTADSCRMSHNNYLKI